MEIQQLIQIAKTVIIRINRHRKSHESVDQYMRGEIFNIDAHIFKKMVELDEIVEIHASTQGKYYRTFHYNFDQAVNITLLKLKANL